MSVSWSRECYRRMVNLRTPPSLFHTLVLSNSTFISLKSGGIISNPSCKHQIRQPPPLVMSDNEDLQPLHLYLHLQALYILRPTLPKTNIPRATRTSAAPHPLHRPSPWHAGVTLHTATLRGAQTEGHGAQGLAHAQERSLRFSCSLIKGLAPQE